LVDIVVLPMGLKASSSNSVLSLTPPWGNAALSLMVLFENLWGASLVLSRGLGEGGYGESMGGEPS